jgi:cyclohexanone monooxygenase
MWASFSDILATQEANDTAADFIRDKIRATVKDPAVA